MNKIAKNFIALSISTAFSVSFVTNVNAATYQIVEKIETDTLRYTYAQSQNNNGAMAASGNSIYNFPIKFEYLDDEDFDSIEIYTSFRHVSVHSLEDIEDSDALRAGIPTANDLSWVIRWLQDTNISGARGVGRNIEYQKIGDSIALTNINGVTKEYNLFDVAFEDSDELTRSTIDIVSGITESGISYGTATAPYLPSETYVDPNDNEHTFWLREHGQRGFYSYDNGAQIHAIIPFETQNGGGISSIEDVNESGVAVGFSSFKLSEEFIDIIEDESGGCADTGIVPARLTLDACYAEAQLSPTFTAYDSVAFKATLSPDGSPVIEQLGLLVTPHPDDERSYSSYALAINNAGIAVGYADGYLDEAVITPAVNERSFYQYAVVYKNGDVIDLSGDHSNKGTSIAFDINDAGIAVGHITNDRNIRKFFYVDTNLPKEEINMINPNDFFTGSDSSAKAINNNGLIVGEGEIETHNESSQNPRRTAAFVYNINNDTLTNLNKAIPCALRLSYSIIEARDINDAGIISATATVKVDRRDSKGNILLNPDGSPLTEDVVKAITLEPIPDNGEVCSAEEESKVIRQGASVSVSTLLTVLALFGLRRKFSTLLTKS